MQRDDGVYPDSWLADHELLQKAAAEDFAGPVTGRLLTQLVRYALPVISSLIESDAIFKRLRQLTHGRPGGFYLPARPLSSDQIYTLALDSVHGGVDLFLARERDGRGWQPDGRAALSTWFVNGCILSFRTPWKNMVEEMRASDRTRPSGLTDGGWLNEMDNQPGPEQRAVTVAELQRLLARVPGARNRQIIVMTAQGYTCAAIGEVLGMREHAVGQRLRRLRQQFRNGQ
ncbi:MAG: hypothetical protein LC799_19415 [Actinobacteria bacterium]|nr:hypothetical protein [Actinomycetota bacterium]